MGKASRDKGARFEREIANDLTDRWGVSIKRNIGQARDGGDDITVDPFRIECKRRAKIAGYDFIEQATAATDEGQIPVVVMRADGKKPLVLMRYDDWCMLAQGELIGKGGKE